MVQSKNYHEHILKLKRKYLPKMTYAQFHTIFSKKIKFDEILIDILKKSSEDNYGTKSFDELRGFIDIEYKIEITGKRYLLGFTVSFQDVEPDTDIVIKSFCKSVQEYPECELIIKYKDENMFANLSETYFEIFEIEMKLREILNIIFITTYESDYYNFLEFQKLSAKPIVRNVKEPERPQFFKDRFQNEFFFMTFNQYANLKVPDIIKADTVSSLIADKKRYKSLKDGLLKLGVFNDNKADFIDFLNSINEDMPSIEIIRNCVAHNREPTEEEIQNYEKARDNVNQKMDDFMSGIEQLN